MATFPAPSTHAKGGVRAIAILATLLAACSSETEAPASDPSAASTSTSGAGAASGSTAASTTGGPQDDGGTGTSPPGTTTEIGTCDPGTLPGTTCTRLSVACPSTPDIGVSVRITKPERAALGTVVLQSGGAGNYYFQDFPEIDVFTAELAAAGFVVVQRMWDFPGWFEGTAGVHASSCRFATLLGWIEEKHGSAAPLCAVGTSGGAVELAFALSRWDAADRLAGALLISGPSISALDVVCPSVATRSWFGQGCPALAAQYGVTPCEPLLCTVHPEGAAIVTDSAWMPDHPCTDPADADLRTLALDGCVSPDMRKSYPATKVGMALGGDECSVTPLVYYDSIESERTLEIVPGAPHGVLGIPAGDTAVRAMFKAICADY